MSEARAVKYAEENLRVHVTYDDARAALEEMRKALERVADYASMKRMTNEAIADRVAELTSSERGRLHELSATAFEQHIKTAVQLDPDLQKLRRTLLSHQHDHDVAEAEAKEAEYRVRVHAARMEELGGLLHFYAATKAATVQRTVP